MSLGRMMLRSRQRFTSNHKFLKMPAEKGDILLLRKAFMLSILILIISISLLVLLYTIFFSTSQANNPHTHHHLNLSRFFTYCPGCLNNGAIPDGISMSKDDTSSATVLMSSTPTTPTNITHIQFGLSGSTKTWSHRQKYTQLWWQPNITRGYVFLDSNPPNNLTWPETSPPYKVSTHPKNNKTRSSGDRIARIVKESYDMRLRDVRWFVMGDDDTLFFTENLVNVLSRYDYHEMYYIGMSSESIEQNVVHSYGTAFGGGGYVISYGLAEELSKILDGCIERYRWLFGSDEKVSACVAELGVSFTRIPGFHQFDVKGDSYGLLAAHPIAPLITLHHLDAIKPLFPYQTQLDSLKILMQAYNADPGRTIQQSICYDYKRKWSVSISWGYTIQLYPKIILPKQLATPLLTFRTWKSLSGGPFLFNTRAWMNDPCKQPLIYFLDKVKVVGEGTVTRYKRVGIDNHGKMCTDRLDYKRAMEVEGISVSTAGKMDYQDLIMACNGARTYDSPAYYRMLYVNFVPPDHQLDLYLVAGDYKPMYTTYRITTYCY